MQLVVKLNRQVSREDFDRGLRNEGFNSGVNELILSLKTVIQPTK